MVMNYMQNPAKWRTTDEDARQHQLSLETAHRKAFEVVCDTVEKDVLYRHKNCKVIRFEANVCH